MASLNLGRLKERLVKALTPWFLGREQDALIEAMKTAGEETLLAVDVDTDALQAQLTNLYSNAGADAIGIADAGGYYTGTSVEDALQEVGGLIGGVSPVTSVFGRSGAVVAQTGDYTKTQVGLGNVDNTADLAKPVSTAQQTALNLKANLASPTFTGTVGGITKTMVGLGSVDNTSDAAKPVSTATQTALNLKANLASPTFTGTVGGITKTMVGLGNVDNTSDAAKPVSTAQQTALNLKADISGQVFTGRVAATSLTITGDGIYEPGCIYSNVNWGMLFRGRQTGAVGAFAFYNFTGTELARISETGVLTTTGDVVAAGAQFIGSASVAILRPATAGTVYLRPNGTATGQVTVDTAGNMTVLKVTITGAGAMYADGAYLKIDPPIRSYSATADQKASADLAAWVRVPRVFVQSADPGVQAADGDLWFW